MSKKRNLSHLNGISLLATRFLVAFVFLWHGLPKALDPSWAAAKFMEFGLPGWLGPTIGWVEVVASTLLIVGYRSRWASLILAAVIAGAIVTVQAPAGFTAGLERDLLILVATLLLSVQGPGSLALEEVSEKVHLEPLEVRKPLTN